MIFAKTCNWGCQITINQWLSILIFSYPLQTFLFIVRKCFSFKKKIEDFPIVILQWKKDILNSITFISNSMAKIVDQKKKIGKRWKPSSSILLKIIGTKLSIHWQFYKISCMNLFHIKHKRLKMENLQSLFPRSCCFI